MTQPVGSSASGGPRVAVIGAGIVGCCIALELLKRGAAVTLIDRDEPGRACSFGNSGAISPASVAPLAMPGILSTLPSMLFDRSSPLRLPLRYLPRAAPWLLRFLASARPERVTASTKALAALHAGAIEAHEALAADIGVPELFSRRGHLHLYPNQAALDKDSASWLLRKEFGYKFEQLDRAGILSLEPRVGERYQMGMYLPGHATILNPFRYVCAVAAAFASRGGLVERAEVLSLKRSLDNTWQLEFAHAASTAPVASFDHVVVATGAWSNMLLAPLGLRIPLETQRGYHVQLQGARDTVSRTVVLADRKVFVTPMEGGLRIGGTVEIAGLHAPPDMARARTLSRIASESFTGLDSAQSGTEWMGHRPCMPDSVPVVGPAAEHPGLWLAVGHGHLGLTDSVNTSLRIADRLVGSHSNISCNGSI